MDGWEAEVIGELVLFQIGKEDGVKGGEK